MQLPCLLLAVAVAAQPLPAPPVDIIDAYIPRDVPSVAEAVVAAPPTLAASLSGAPPVAASAPLVSQTVSERIAHNSQQIGFVARSLLDVQDSIDKVEAEVQGKVFDMETLRTFLASHRGATEDALDLQNNVTKAKEQVAWLEAQLRAVQELSKARKVKHEKEVYEVEEEVKQEEKKIEEVGSRLKNMSIRNETKEVKKEVKVEEPVKVEETVKEIEKEIEKKEVEYKTEDAVVEKENEVLQKEVKKEEETVIHPNTEALKAAQAELGRRKALIKSLEDELLKQHNYGMECHGRATGLIKQGEAERARLAAEKSKVANAEAAAKQAQAVLVAQNFEMTGRLKKAKANVATIQTQIVSTQERHSSLITQGDAEIGKLREVLGRLHAKKTNVEIELNARIDARIAVEKAVKEAEKEVRRLQDILLSGRMAELRRNSSTIREHLKLAHSELQVSQAAVVQAQDKMQLANESIRVFQQEAAESHERARQITQASLAQIAAVKKSHDDATQAAENAAMEAEASQLTDCADVWNEDHKEVLEELERCEQVKLDLQNANAQLAALTGTVQASKIAEPTPEPPVVEEPQDELP